jgi:ribonuclease BN (tRNA processing enzyme)
VGAKGAGLELRVAGCGDAFGSGGRSHACFVLRGRSGSILLDCGPSSLPALKRVGVRPGDLDAVLVSHLHGDHFGGIPLLLLEHRHLDPRDRLLHVAGPRGLERRVEETAQALLGTGVEGMPVEFHRLSPGSTLTIGPALVEAFTVEHQPDVPCLGLRVRMDGRTVVYSGDTRWFEGLVDASRGADLFLWECTYLDEEGRNHTRLDDVIQHRDRLECERFLLVHLGPRVLARRDDHDLPWAEDGMRLEL